MKEFTSTQKKKIVFRINMIIGAVVFLTFKDKFTLMSKEFFLWASCFIFITTLIASVVFHCWDKNSKNKIKNISYDILSAHFREGLGIDKEADVSIKDELEKLVEEMLKENANFISQDDYQKFLDKKEEIKSRINQWFLEEKNKQIKIDKKIVELHTGVKYEGEFLLTHNDIAELVKRLKGEDEESTYTFRESFLKEIEEIYIDNSGSVNFSDIREIVSLINYNREKISSLCMRENNCGVSLHERIKMDLENILHDVYQEEKKHENLHTKNIIGLKIVK